MATATINVPEGTITLNDSQIVNPKDFSYHDKLFVLYDRATLEVCAAVYESTDHDALDELADSDALDAHAALDVDFAGYCPARGTEEGCDHALLGNADQCFELGDLWLHEIKLAGLNPSICTAINEARDA